MALDSYRLNSIATKERQSFTYDIATRKYAHLDKNSKSLAIQSISISTAARRYVMQLHFSFENKSRLPEADFTEQALNTIGNILDERYDDYADSKVILAQYDPDGGRVLKNGKASGIAYFYADVEFDDLAAFEQFVKRWHIHDYYPNDYKN